MATYAVDELFPGATIAGMDAVPGFDAVPGSSAGIRAVHVHVYETDQAPELQALVRKGSARGARMARFKTTLAEVPEGVRAQGTFGPDQARPACAVIIVALFVIVVEGYYIITRHAAMDFIMIAVAIAALFFVRPLGRLLSRNNDDWSERDLASLRQYLHERYDGADCPTTKGDEEA